VASRCLLIGVFKQQSNDKKFITEVCCFLCELQSMSPITEIVVVTTGPAVGVVTVHKVNDIQLLLCQMTQLTVVIHDSGPAQWPILTARVSVTS